MCKSRCLFELPGLSLSRTVLIGETVQIELESNPTPDLELHIAQSALLSQVGLMFSGNMSFAEHAQRNMSLVPTLCKRANYFVEHHPNPVTSGGGESWKWWIQAESRKRLVHLAWVSTLANLFIKHRGLPNSPTESGFGLSTCLLFRSRPNNTIRHVAATHAVT